MQLFLGTIRDCNSFLINKWFIKTKLSLRDNIQSHKPVSHDMFTFLIFNKIAIIWQILFTNSQVSKMEVWLLTLLLAVFCFTSLPFFIVDCWYRCIWILYSEVLERAELVDNNIIKKPLKLVDYSRGRKKNKQMNKHNTPLSKPSTIVSIKNIHEINKTI